MVACREKAVNLDGMGEIAAYSRKDLLIDGSPVEERKLGPAPSRIFRLTVGDRGGPTIEPSRLLDQRASALLRRKDRD
jgi:hypothetical protein